MNNKIKFYSVAIFIISIATFFIKPLRIEENSKQAVKQQKIEPSREISKKIAVKTKKIYFALSSQLLANQDFSLISGIWFAENGKLKSTKDNVSLNIKIFLNTQGKGSKLLSVGKNIECKSDIQAFFLADGRFSIRDNKAAKCNNHSIFARSTILCSLKDNGQTECLFEQDNQKKLIPVLLYRLE